MKLIEIHRGHLKLEALGRTITIGGEGFVRTDAQTVPNLDYVDYVVYMDTLTHWDKPWENEPLTTAVQSAVVDFLKADFEQREMLLAIE